MNPKTIRLFLVLVLCCASALVRAQSGNRPSLSLVPELGLPFNTEYAFIHAKDVYQNGAGIGLRAELPVTAQLHFTVSAGYMRYQTNIDEKDGFVLADYGTGVYVTPQPLPYKYIPVKVGLRYYYANYFYASGELGNAFKTGYAAKSSFIYSGGLGAIAPIGIHHGIDFGVRYERGYKNVNYNFTMSQLAISVAYKYQF